MLAKNTQRFILYTAFTQSILLLIIHELIDRDAWPATSMPLRVLWYTLALALPTTVCLLLREVRGRRFWTLLGVYGLVLTPLALHAGTQYVPEHHTQSWTVFFPYVVVQLGLWFLVTFFIEAAQDGGHLWHTPKDVCAYAWRNFLTLGLLMLFFGVLTLVLLLWALLFKLLKIEFFWFLFFDSHRFIYPFFGVTGGIGVLILRNQANVVDLMEKVAGALLRLLLPLVALIAILFLATLPFTGVQLLWKTGEGGYLMMWLVCLMLLLVNVTRQHERDAYQRILEWVVRITFLLLPVYLALSAWGIGIRVAQYGWSSERIWTVVILLLQSCFVMAYVLAMNLPGKSWTERLPMLNKNLGALVAAVLVLLSTPLLDPLRLTAADQMSRLVTGKVTPDKFDYTYLRFRLGEYGYQSLLTLQDSPLVTGDVARDEYLKKLIATKNFWMTSYAGVPGPTTIDVLPKGAMAPPELMTFVKGIADQNHVCASPTYPCALIAADIKGDGKPEYLFVNGYMNIEVIDRSSGQWGVRAWMRTERGDRDRARLIDALSSGRFKLEPPAYPDIVIDGERHTIIAGQEY